ncbi:DNA-binding protein H-NS [Rhodobacter aestuarii]|uniref:DNA-binding protein H-NS n=1 Tax=Rhodobacter aestuarii TaxID=453582 RepID=A0A1N7LGV5_9RHOB|nr:MULTISPECIES: H-NS histone family protein [Rhodobacter]PTV95260.1 DNA-binding protein H-NS [Rhodobacter aestuarii]SIS73062.1 DNA-binding protein H-NS [Rhodobacter aestuarii]SOC08053.1 DNA-binding protein H-NS [Rhodobacter sp. JA431]
MDIEDLSLSELKALRAKVDRAIVTYEDRKKKEALSELEDVARKMGYSLAELTEMTVKKPRKAVAPKYRNPENAEETWTGRGRKPKWVEAALSAGKTIDDLLIA